MNLCVAMIVKNEAANIERCLASVLPIANRFVIIDTGSDDNTFDLAHQCLELPDKKAWFAVRKWKGFAENRTELLAMARENVTDADYVLMLDADMEVCTSGPLPELTEDAYRIKIHDRGVEYPLILLTSNHKTFRYEGVAHCEVGCDDPDATVGDLPGLWVIDHGGQRSALNIPKLEGDLERLRGEINAGRAGPRETFFYANTLRDLGHFKEAVDGYLMRANMSGGDEEEVYYSLFQAGVIMCAHFSVGQGMPLLLEAWLARPTRVEALRALALVASERADLTPFPENDHLLVKRSAYGAQPDMTAVGIDPKDVCAIVLTKGDTDLTPILKTLPYGEILIAYPHQTEFPYLDIEPVPTDYDSKIYGRYKAMLQTSKKVVYFQDDDLIFREHEKLCAAYEPGKIVCNMDPQWVKDCGYHDIALVGAGSLVDRNLPFRALNAYQNAYPGDDRFDLDCDFINGILTPSKVLDLGCEILDLASDESRLWRQPGQLDGKLRTINRARALRDRKAVAA